MTTTQRWQWMQNTRWPGGAVHAYDTSRTVRGEYVSACEDYSETPKWLADVSSEGKRRVARCTLCTRES